MVSSPRLFDMSVIFHPYTLTMSMRNPCSVKYGFDQPYEQHPHLLATVFSASGYSGSNNLGAYVSFSRSVAAGEKYFVVGKPELLKAADYIDSETGLFFTVRDYSVSEAVDSLENTNKTSIRALILRKRKEIQDEFVKQDASRAGKVSPAVWGSVLANSTGLMINWATLLPLLEIQFDQNGLIDYSVFMSELRVNLSVLNQTEDSDTLFNAMYVHRPAVCR